MSDRDFAQQRPLIQLPPDRTAAVITMDIRGGYGPQRKDNRPLLTIFADGTVRAINESGIKLTADELQELLRVVEESGIKFSAEERQNLLRVDTDQHSDIGPIFEAKISAEELQDLFRFAIDEHHFFDLDSENAQRELDAEKAKNGLEMAVYDGVWTVIRIRTAERDHEAKFYALYDYVTTFPELKSLVHLSAVQERLSRMRNEICAGGKESIEAALKLANEHLQKTFPNVPAVVFEDFLYIDFTPDGRTLYFVRALAERQPRDVNEGFRKWFFGEPEFSVAVTYLNDGTLKITVRNPPR